MEKAILTSLKPKWWQMIASGEKILEFRGNNAKNWKQGMTIYVYETKGKKVKKLRNPHIDCGSCHMLGGSQCDECKYYIGYEGIGKVVGHFIIGVVYDINYYPKYKMIDLISENKKGTLFKYGGSTICDKGYDSLGFDEIKHKYAIEIKDLEVYDTPKDKEEFITWNSWENLYNENKEQLSRENIYLNDLTLDYLTEVGINKLDYISVSPQSFYYVVKHENT